MELSASGRQHVYVVRDTTPSMAMSRGKARGLLVSSELPQYVTFWVGGLFVGPAYDAVVHVPPSTPGGAFFIRLRRKLTSMDLRVSESVREYETPRMKLDMPR